MNNSHTDTPPPRPPRFGYERSFWALITAGLLTGWLLRWACAPALPSGGWADLTASLMCMAAGGTAAGGIARWRHRRHGTGPHR
ncbi:hypothetical protein AW27_030295 [Streptomyces sp. PCS3-D2]|uniref:hypothetical protein n=1 Tax=Streptomyces sp. PCS3-D2 TaxID=1460244 RepID=UPI00055ADB72|nr:hypothetical protein [Streptomyces sp. PCS3-D2]WKV75435.1 hypothetical protein AW27_030295 [Streptomyces sp. PCS3-D2]